MELPDGPALTRPGDLARLLLAADAGPPRRRARDQQADRAGLDLKRRVLDALVAVDPEPEDLEAALLTVVEGLGPPTGPTRSVAIALFEEWQTAVTTPEWVAQLLGEAVRAPEAEGGRRGRQLPA